MLIFEEAKVLPEKVINISESNVFKIKCLVFSEDFEKNSDSESYTTFFLKNPPYAFSRACGESQLNSVIKGSILASKFRSRYKIGDICDGKNQHRKASVILFF